MVNDDFDPDAFLAEDFDPDAFLAEGQAEKPANNGWVKDASGVWRKNVRNDVVAENEPLSPEEERRVGVPSGREKTGAAGGALQGAGSGFMLDWMDEAQGALGALDPTRPTDATPAQRALTEEGVTLGPVEWMKQRYGNSKGAAQRHQNFAKEDQPLPYAASKVAGSTGAFLLGNAATGGALMTPLGGGAFGGLAGAGSSHADVGSKQFVQDTTAGAGMGLALPILGKASPILTGAGLTALGAAGAADSNLPTADRIESGIGAVLAAGGTGAAALSKGRNALGDKFKAKADEGFARAVEDNAPKVQSAERAEAIAGRRAKKAAQRPSDIREDAKAAALERLAKAEKGFTDAEQNVRTAQQEQVMDFADRTHKAHTRAKAEANEGFAKEFQANEQANLQGFKKAVGDLSNRRAEADRGLVDAFMKSEAKKVAAAAGEAADAGTDPALAARSALGNKAKEFYAGVRTQLGLGKPLTPEMETALKVLHPDFEANLNTLAGEFKGGKAALMEQLLRKYEAEAAAKRPPVAGGDDTVPSYMANIEAEVGANPYAKVGENTRARIAPEFGLSPEDVQIREPTLSLNPNRRPSMPKLSADDGSTLANDRARPLLKKYGLQDPGEAGWNANEPRNYKMDPRMLPVVEPGESAARVIQAKEALNAAQAAVKKAQERADAGGMGRKQTRALERALEMLSQREEEFSAAKTAADQARFGSTREGVAQKGTAAARQAAADFVPTGPLDAARGYARKAVGIPVPSAMKDPAVRTAFFDRLANTFSTDKSLVKYLPVVEQISMLQSLEQVQEAVDKLNEIDPRAGAAVADALAP